MPSPYRPLIEQAASVFNLDANLVDGLIAVESGHRADAFRHEPGFYRRYLKGKPEWEAFNPRRVSSSYGLMQIMYPTAVMHGFQGEPELLFVPEINLDWGCRHLVQLIDWAGGNTYKALAAYNGGLGNWKSEKPQAYARKVLARVERIKRELEA